MRRATTPTHVFTFPEEIKVNELEKVLLTYEQMGKLVFEKELEDLSVREEENSIAYALTQAETRLFSQGIAKVQLRIKKGATVMASQILVFDVKPVLSEEEL